MIGREAIFKLLPERQGPCVSLYVPSVGMGRSEQHAVRFQNLLRCVENDLQLYNITGIDTETLMANAHPERFDSPFWQEPSQGIAAFLAADFSLIEHLPYPIAMQYRLANRFHVLPLIPLIDPFQRFFVLSLSQGDARFFEATPHSMREIDLSDRKSKPELRERDRASHGAEYQNAHGSDGRGALATENSANSTITIGMQQGDLLESLRMTDRKLYRILLGERAPLLVAGFGFVASLYEGVNSYRNLLPVRIPGSPTNWTVDELHARAVDIVMPFLDRERHFALSAFGSQDHQTPTTTMISEAVIGADQGRIKTMFLAHGGEYDGYYDQQQQTVMLDPTGDDLLEYAAARTLLTGGQVCVLNRNEMPGGQTLAAVLRAEDRITRTR